MSEHKSVLDSVPVNENQNFKDLCGTKESPPNHKPLQGGGRAALAKGLKDFKVSGNCPHCGSPVLMEQTRRLAVREIPEVRRTCDCWIKPGPVTQNYETK